MPTAMPSGSSDQLEPVHLPAPAVRLQRWTWRLVLGAAAIGLVSACAAEGVRLLFVGLQKVLTGSGAELPVDAAHLAPLRRALTPVGGALLALLVLWLRDRLSRPRDGQPAPYVGYVEAVRHRGGLIPLAPNVWRTLSAAFSIASGAAVGREGSMIQFAATVASTVGRWRLFTKNALRESPVGFLAACGVAGGVTAAYNAPVAATFFAAEIVLGYVHPLELPLLGLAAGSGWLAISHIAGSEPLYPASPAVPLSWQLLWLPVLAVAIALVGPVYQLLLAAGRRLRGLPLALLLGGLVAGLTSVADPRVWGNGNAGLDAALGLRSLPGWGSGPHALLHVILLRLTATLVCVWTGTVGGVFTPTLFLGGALGSLAGQLVGQPVLWGIVGMCCLMAAVTHAPLMAAFMGAELTGDWRLLALLLPLCFVSRAVARRLSPRALYAIASQAPEAAPPAAPTPRANGTVNKA